MQIITGKLKGKIVPTIPHYRPTTSKIRESIFNILAHLYQDNIFAKNINVLDICSGSGTLSFEAISRGAKNATMIDKNYKALLLAKKFASQNNLTNRITTYCCKWIELPIAKRAHQLVFVDPPYNINAIQEIITHIDDRNWIDKKAIIIIETNSRTKFLLDENLFSLLRKITYSNTKIEFYEKV